MMELNMAPHLSQHLSPFQQQSLTMLALPLPELREYLSRQLQDYPLLELRDQGTESLTALSERADFPGEEDVFWGDGLAAGRQDADPLLFLRKPQTFTEDLLFQLAALELSPLLRKCCMYIIYSLSPRGYLLDSEEELARQTGIALADIQQAVYVVQSLSPPGVGAHDLSECLVLQLVASKLFNPYTIRIVKDHLDDLAAGRWGRIAAALGISRGEAEHWCAQIRQLNPIPSKGYAGSGYVPPIVPEAAVTRELSVIMNQSALPVVAMAEEYQDMLLHARDSSVRQFLLGNLQQSQSLASQLDRRQKTLLDILVCVARLQPEYFQIGPAKLLPMTMEDVASELSLHVSTISRAVNGKYIDTAWGPVALRSLFTGALAGESTSTGGVKARLRELIRRENPAAPLSDNQLCALLAAEHIGISRRTVAKYRHERKIPSAASRRREAGGSSE